MSQLTPQSNEKPAKSGSRYTSALNFLKEMLPILSQLSILITLGGFVVVQSYLATITDFFTYNINLIQYLAAGASLLWYIPAALINAFGRSLGPAFRLLAIFGGICVVFVVVHMLWQRRQHQSDPTRSVVSLKTALDSLLRLLNRFQPIHRAYDYFSLVVVVIYAVGAGILYGRADYANVPRWMGGGQPAAVILVFTKDVDPSSLPFAVVGLRSSVLKLIAELTDGVLVWDDNIHVAIKVKNEMINAIVGAAPGATPVFPTPTVTPTMTPTTHP